MTTAIKSWKNLLRDDQGHALVLIALFAFILIGFTAFAVDVGAWFSGKTQLQNAADSAALAAANTMVQPDADGNSVLNAVLALNTAKSYSSKNQSLGVSLNLVDPPSSGNMSTSDDFVIGYWNFETKDFDYSRTGLDLSSPDDVTAIRVRLRRDEIANTPLPAFFAGVWGMSSANARAQTVAFLGWSSNVSPGTVDLPLAVVASAISGEDGANCGSALTFRANNTQNTQWTTFFTTPANNPTTEQYVTGELEAPALKVGDEITVNNGELSNNTFKKLYDRYVANQENGVWRVTLPVIAQASGGSNAATVAGFATIDITGVETAPDKLVTGVLHCGMSIPNSGTGGGNYGSRATIARIIN